MKIYLSKETIKIITKLAKINNINASKVISNAIITEDIIKSHLANGGRVFLQDANNLSTELIFKQ